MPVEVDGERLEILADDADALAGAEPVDGVRLLGPFDLFLQGRDRELRAARRGRPQGSLAHHRPARGSARRPRGRRQLAAAVVRQEAQDRR